MAKDNSQVIKQMWTDWRDDYRGKEKYMSPFGLADSVAINEFPKQLITGHSAGAQLSRDILFHFWQKYFFS